MGKDKCASVKSVKSNCQSNRQSNRRSRLDSNVDDNNDEEQNIKATDEEPIIETKPSASKEFNPSKEIKSNLIYSKSQNQERNVKNVRYPKGIHDEWPHKCYPQCKSSCSTLKSSFDLESKSSKKAEIPTFSRSTEISSQLLNEPDTKSNRKSSRSPGSTKSGRGSAKSTSGQSNKSSKSQAKSREVSSKETSQSRPASSKSARSTKSATPTTRSTPTRSRSGKSKEKSPESKSKKVPEIKFSTIPESEPKKVLESKCSRIPECKANKELESKSKKEPELKYSIIPEDESKKVPESISNNELESKSSKSLKSSTTKSDRGDQKGRKTVQSSDRDKTKSNITFDESVTTAQSYKTAGKICRCSTKNFGDGDDDLPCAMNYLVYFFRNVYNDPFRWSIVKSVLMFLVCVKIARETKCIAIPIKHYEPFVD